MIETLQKLIPTIIEATKKVEGWDSLIINRRKPHTYRVFQEFDGLRVCLHRFSECDTDEAFPHPHPWPGAFLMLQGAYVHTIGCSPDLNSQPEFIFREVVRPFTMYEIINPRTWHKVQPLMETYTVMVNGTPWDTQHKETRTTKGKDLEKMSKEELEGSLHIFQNLLRTYSGADAMAAHIRSTEQG